MSLSVTGKIVEKVWVEIPRKFNNASLDVFQIMPNHFHGIIIIKPNPRKNLIYQVQNRKNTINNVPTKSGIPNNPMVSDSVSIGRLIRWFKGRVKYEAAKVDSTFKWQARYHDRIIRNEKEYYFIQEYIINNRVNWKRGIMKEYLKK